MTDRTPREFKSLNIAVLTVSDTRTEQNDSSGGYLCEALQATGHRLFEKVINRDDRYQIRATVSAWITNSEVQIVLITGGTGFAARDVTPEAVGPLLDKTMPGFGELFRYHSIADVGTSTVQSRALGGVANHTFIFCLPGSTGACRTAWEKVLKDQLDYRHRPCNFVELLPQQ